MAKNNDHIIPLLSKRFMQKGSAGKTTSRVMRHVVKETAKMAANENKPEERKIVTKHIIDKSGMN